MRFDSYHPIINFIFYIAVFVCICILNHPIFITIAYIVAFAWSVKLNGRKALQFNLCLILCLLAYTVWYASYHHFGVTNLWQNDIGNWITVESIVYGFARGVKAAAVIMEFSCVLATVTSDKITYLLGRVSPKLSLFVSILLRSIPRIKNQMRKIDVARQGVGRGIGQGNLFWRLWHLIGLLSITITWGMEHLIESAMSMKSRGYSLKGRKAFAIYRFDDRDRCFLIGIVACIVLTYMAHILGETMMYYDPMIVWKPITGASILCYVIYAVFLLLPLMLQIYGEWQFEKSRKTIL